MAEPEFSTLKLRVGGDEPKAEGVPPAGVAHLRLSRPEAGNALNEAMVDDLHRALAYLRQRSDICVVVLDSEGDKAFVSGADIAELKERDAQDALRMINTGLFRAIETLPVPTIAAVSGWALGGGCELALSCDVRLAAENAKFGQPEVALGIIPGAGATYRLQRAIGPGMARELIFTGRIIDAQEAMRIGLVNRVVPTSELLSESFSLAAQMAKNSASALRFAKLSAVYSQDMSTDAAMAYEATAQARLFEEADKHRRMQAFLDRKKS